VVFYGCEIYADQLNAGDDYTQHHPVYSICLVNGILWRDAKRVHHAFRLTDQESGRVLDKTIEIHTLELGRYNLTEADLVTALIERSSISACLGTLPSDYRAPIVTKSSVVEQPLESIFEARVSSNLIATGILLAAVFSGLFLGWWIWAPSLSRLSLVTGFLFTFTTFFLFARWWYDYPVIELSNESIVFRHHLVSFLSSEIPLKFIARAYCFWDANQTDEDAPTLIVELKEFVHWNRQVLNGELNVFRRDRYGLPRNARLLEFPCANCSPSPSQICDKINLALVGNGRFAKCHAPVNEEVGSS